MTQKRTSNKFQEKNTFQFDVTNEWKSIYSFKQSNSMAWLFVAIATCIYLFSGCTGNAPNFEICMVDRIGRGTNVYDGDSTFHLLIIPLTSTEAVVDENNLLERSIAKRFQEFFKTDSLAAEVVVACKMNTIPSQGELEKLLTTYRADCIVWGSFDMTNKTSLTMNYITQDRFLGMDSWSQGKEVVRIKNGALHEKIDSGLITGSIEDVIFWNFTWIALNKGDYKKSLEYVLKIGRYSQFSNYNVLKIRGFNYLKLGYDSLAYESLTKARKLREEPISLNDLGIVTYRLGRYNEAITVLNRAIEIDPNYEFAYASRGAAYNLKGQVNKALQDYEMAYSLDTNSVVTKYNMAAINYILGNYQQALKYINQLIQNFPNDGEYHGGKAEILLAMGKIDQAKKSIGTARSIDPQNIELITIEKLVYAKEG